MAPGTATRTVRQKKLSKTAGQQILREDQVEDYDSLSLHTETKADTGVEKSEEKARASHMINTSRVLTHPRKSISSPR